MTRRSGSTAQDARSMSKKKTSATKSAKSPVATRRKEPVELGRALIRAFLTNERINQTLLDLLDPRIWREMPSCTKRRNIATSFAHIHNVRCMRLTMSAKGTPPPARLDRAEVTRELAKKALEHSAGALVRLIESSLAAGGHVPEYRPDVAALVCAAIAHEAHHRGQICHWARVLGSPISPEQQLQIWEWDKRAKEVDYPGGS